MSQKINPKYTTCELSNNDSSENSNDPWPYFIYTGKIRPWKRLKSVTIPSNITRPDYADHPQHISLSEENSNLRSILSPLSSNEIRKMRVVCQLAREVLDEVAKMIGVGVTGEDIDEVVYKACIQRNSYPSPYLYYNFPKCCTTSVNEIVCHGIPDSRPLRSGDIVNVDVTLYHDGFHGDVNETFLIGEVDESAKKLVKVTHESILKAIEIGINKECLIVRPGTPYRKIGETIENYIESHGYSAVKDYTGHGINRCSLFELSIFHCKPTVYHVKNKSKYIMEEGHTFTIEPMINEGCHHTVEWPDEWTVATQDGRLSSQFEQTILVTKDGHEILTQRKNKPYFPYFLDSI